MQIVRGAMHDLSSLHYAFLCFPGFCMTCITLSRENIKMQKPVLKVWLLHSWSVKFMQSRNQHINLLKTIFLRTDLDVRVLWLNLSLQFAQLVTIVPPPWNTANWKQDSQNPAFPSSLTVPQLGLPSPPSSASLFTDVSSDLSSTHRHPSGNLD